MHKKYILRKEGNKSPWVLDKMHPEEAIIAEVCELKEMAFRYSTYNTLTDKMNEILADFTEREQEIIRCRFGYKGEFYTCAAVGEMFNISHSRIQQIEERVLRKIKFLIRRKKITPNNIRDYHSIFNEESDVDFKKMLVPEITTYLYGFDMEETDFFGNIVKKNSIAITSASSEGKEYESIYDLDLWFSTACVLRDAGITTVDQLFERFNKGKKNFMQIEGMTKNIYTEIEHKINEITAEPGTVDLCSSLFYGQKRGLRIRRNNSSVICVCSTESSEIMAETVYDILKTSFDSFGIVPDYDMSIGLKMLLLMKGHFYLKTILEENKWIEHELKEGGFSKYIPELESFIDRSREYMLDRLKGDVKCIIIDNSVVEKIKKANSTSYYDLKTIFTNAKSKDEIDYAKLFEENIQIDDQFVISDRV